VAAPGVVLRGHLELNGSANVIIRNLKIVGYNCADANQCKLGKDAITIEGGSHHIWLDHCDISDGSDGNMDIGDGADLVTVSWTKFWYSARRPGDHQFSNLLGSSDNAADTDRGHIRVTFDHDWWADNVSERMPRVRFGQVHVFNSLYTSVGNRYCIGLGVGASILAENNAFIGVRNPINAGRFADETSVIVGRGNLFERTDGTNAARDTGGFTPPYQYTLEPAAAVHVSVTRGAGIPRPPGTEADEEDDESGPPAAP
jgi:pectate lyase